LNTPLNGFLGPAYNYDDHTLTEEWMVSFCDDTNKPSDEEVIRTQLVSILEVMLGQVQDRVCNSIRILDVPPVGLGSRLKEFPVWGIDSYTRKMIELAIRDNQNTCKASVKSIVSFVERKLLPTINAQHVDEAYNICFSLQSIIEVLKIFSSVLHYC
jgi:hypothetical protein